MNVCRGKLDFEKASTSSKRPLQSPEEREPKEPCYSESSDDDDEMLEPEEGEMNVHMMLEEIGRTHQDTEDAETEEGGLGDGRTIQFLARGKLQVGRQG